MHVTHYTLLFGPLRRNRMYSMELYAGLELRTVPTVKVLPHIL